MVLPGGAFIIDARRWRSQSFQGQRAGRPAPDAERSVPVMIRCQPGDLSLFLCGIPGVLFLCTQAMQLFPMWHQGRTPAMGEREKSSYNQLRLVPCWMGQENDLEGHGKGVSYLLGYGCPCGANGGDLGPCQQESGWH